MRLPEVMLVRKVYQRRRRQRNWKLKQLVVEREKRYEKKLSKQDMYREDHDRERFLEELEEDPEMRKHVNLWKVERNSKQEETKMVDGDGEESDNPDLPAIG